MKEVARALFVPYINHYVVFVKSPVAGLAVVPDAVDFEQVREDQERYAEEDLVDEDCLFQVEPSTQLCGWSSLRCV